MKKLLLLILFIGFMSYGQAKLDPGTKAFEAQKSVKDGYTTKLGWSIKEGDTLKIGIGSRDMEHFANIYSSPASFTQIMGDGSQDISYLTNDFNGMVAVVKKFGVKGRKKTGYLAYAVVGIGELENYWVEIENAIGTGELIPPHLDHRPVSEAVKVQVVGSTESKYDKLKKLKELLDEGILTKEEYEAEKKKILESE